MYLVILTYSLTFLVLTALQEAQAGQRVPNSNLHTAQRQGTKNTSTVRTKSRTPVPTTMVNAWPECFSTPGSKSSVFDERNLVPSHWRIIVNNKMFVCSSKHFKCLVSNGWVCSKCLHCTCTHTSMFKFQSMISTAVLQKLFKPHRKEQYINISKVMDN